MNTPEDPATFQPHAEIVVARDRALVWLVAIWLAALIVGLVVVWRYKLDAGALGAAPATWPTESRIPVSARGSTLLMAAHPKCPCTRASLGELERLLAEAGEGVRAVVIVVQPRGVAPGWEQTDTTARASKIPGVELFIDEGGVEVRRFGAKTSGEVLLFDEAGALAFHGGITGARGHEGDNEGRARVRALLRRQANARRESPAFGCALEGKPEREENDR